MSHVRKGRQVTLFKSQLKEMEPHPLRWVKTLDVLPWQHIIIFEKKREEKLKPK